MIGSRLFSRDAIQSHPYFARDPVGIERERCTAAGARHRLIEKPGTEPAAGRLSHPRSVALAPLDHRPAVLDPHPNLSRPCGTEKAPYLVALVASSFRRSESAMAESGRSTTLDPDIGQPRRDDVKGLKRLFDQLAQLDARLVAFGQEILRTIQGLEAPHHLVLELRLFRRMFWGVWAWDAEFRGLNAGRGYALSKRAARWNARASLRPARIASVLHQIQRRQ